MSLLDAMPHTCTAQMRSRTKDTLGGSKDSWADVAGFVDRACWRQSANANEIMEFQKRGIRVTHRVYFTADPGLDETHRLVMGSEHLTVRASAHPDASAGLEALWRVYVELE